MNTFIYVEAWYYASNVMYMLKHVPKIKNIFIYLRYIHANKFIAFIYIIIFLFINIYVCMYE